MQIGTECIAVETAALEETIVDPQAGRAGTAGCTADAYRVGIHIDAAAATQRIAGERTAADQLHRRITHYGTARRTQADTAGVAGMQFAGGIQPGATGDIDVAAAREEHARPTQAGNIYAAAVGKDRAEYRAEQRIVVGPGAACIETTVRADIDACQARIAVDRHGLQCDVAGRNHNIALHIDLRGDQAQRAAGRHDQIDVLPAAGCDRCYRYGHGACPLRRTDPVTARCYRSEPVTRRRRR